MIGAGSGNVIEENRVTGNTQGIFIGAGARNTTVRSNIVVGNPGIQVGNTHPDARTADIVNLAPPGQTQFDRNVCVSGVNAPCPAVVPLPQE